MTSRSNPMSDFTPSRRLVLKWTGVATTLAIAGSVLPNFGISAAMADDLGEGDIGVLNYAYALEQLEATNNTQENKTPKKSITMSELAILKVIRDHEAAHVAF